MRCWRRGGRGRGGEAVRVMSACDGATVSGWGVGVPVGDGVAVEVAVGGVVGEHCGLGRTGSSRAGGSVERTCSRVCDIDLDARWVFLVARCVGRLLGGGSSQGLRIFKYMSGGGQTFGGGLLPWNMAVDVILHK